MIRIGRNVGIGSGANSPRRTWPRQFHNSPADLMPTRDVGERGTRLLDLSHDPELLLQPPAATTLRTGDDPSSNPPLILTALV